MLPSFKLAAVIYSSLTGLFLAEEMSIARDIVAPHDTGTNLAEILSSALPAVENNKQNNNKQEKGSDSSAGSGEVSESASTSSLCSNSSHSKAPGAQLAHNRIENNHLYNQQSNGPDILNGVMFFLVFILAIWKGKIGGSVHFILTLLLNRAWCAIH